MEQAGKDPLQDRYTVGYIAGLNDLINAELEEAPND